MQDDLPAVTELIRALWLDDGDEDDPAGFVKALFRTSELERDWWLVEDDRRQFVAGGCVRPRHPHRLRSVGGVLPEHRGRGLGTELRDRIEERAREMAGDAPEGEEVWLGGEVALANESAQRFFEERGYELIRRDWTMGIDLGQELPEPEWPEGIRLARARRGVDERAVWEATEEAFADHWDRHPTPYEEWRRWSVESDDYDPSLWLLAWDGEEIAGISLCGLDADAGWIGMLGVRRPWRRRGLGRALLLQSFSEVRDRGKPQAVLGVHADNPTGATRLYQSVGMRVLNEFLGYRLIVR